MKILSAMVAVLFCGTAFCQQNSLPYIQDRVTMLTKTIKPRIITPSAMQQFDLLIKSAVKIPSGGYIRMLPQDNMPCIVPDMTQFNMPNAWTGKLKTAGAGSIPNPGYQPPLALKDDNKK
jgi:hypothetical protein